MQEKLKRGFFMGGTISTDQKACQKCKTKFIRIKDSYGFAVPQCPKCGTFPQKFYISKRLPKLGSDESRLVRIMYDSANRRLETPFQAMNTLTEINNEIESGKFNPLKYASKKEKEAFKFKAFKDVYLDHHRKRFERGELTPAGYKEKARLVEKVLTPYFGKFDINDISSAAIKKYRDSFTDKLRQRDTSTQELKTLLKFAYQMEFIDKMPVFDKIPRSKKRKEILESEQAKKIIANIENDQYRMMFELAYIYALRPCEVRAIKFKDINKKKKKLVIQSHVSKDIVISGRKSQKDNDEMATLELPLVEKADEIFSAVPWNIDKNAYIFPGKFAAIVSRDSLTSAWNKSLNQLKKKLKIDRKVDSYEIRHARLSELCKRLNGNVVALRQVSGHTNVTTLVERYVRSDNDFESILEY